MHMNGRGPMNRGFGPMGGPMHHRPMGYRPMGMWYRPMGIFPFGGLFILPVLMFGGWIMIAVAGVILSLVGTVIGGIFSGLSALTSVAFSGGRLVIGIIIGLVAFWYFRNRNVRNADDADTEEN